MNSSQPSPTVRGLALFLLYATEQFGIRPSIISFAVFRQCPLLLLCPNTLRMSRYWHRASPSTILFYRLCPDEIALECLGSFNLIFAFGQGRHNEHSVYVDDIHKSFNPSSFLVCFVLHRNDFAKVVPDYADNARASGLFSI
jgi:hypothetical protein